MEFDDRRIVLRNLPNSLIVRRVTREDIEPLAELEGKHMHFPMAFHIREWLRGDHPNATSSGFTVVEDTKTGDIVSAACLLPQMFRYRGIPVRAGQAEAVVTHPDYRLRGLVRAQFECLHAFGDSAGQSMQVVEGILEVYQRFGYELALDNFGGTNSGARAALPENLPQLTSGEADPFTVRPAVRDDLRIVAGLYEKSRSRYCLSVIESPAVWEYVLRGGEPDYNKWFDLRVIIDSSGGFAGFVVQDPWGAGQVFLYEIADGYSWQKVTPSVIRALDVEGWRRAAPKNGTFGGVGFCLAPRHPMFSPPADWIAPEYNHHAEWGVRVADLAAFVRQIAPSLTYRLWLFPVGLPTCNLRINLIGSGLRIKIEDRKIATVENWTPADGEVEDAVIPKPLFMRLLFGQRGVDEISADPDCGPMNRQTRDLLNCLFPKMDSHLGPLA